MVEYSSGKTALEKAREVTSPAQKDEYVLLAIAEELHILNGRIDRLCAIVSRVERGARW